MAKAVIPIKPLRDHLGGTAIKALRDFVERRVLAVSFDAESTPSSSP